MSKYISIILLSSMLLLGCQTTQQASFESSSQRNQTTAQTSSSSFVYDPQGKEEFIFQTKADSLQNYGYDKFCGSARKTSCYNNRLSYAKYVGMRGFFDTVGPIRKDELGNEFYPVTLENGEQYYFVANNKYGGKYGKSKYGASSPITSYAKHLQLKSFKPGPLIKGSSIQIVSVEISFASKQFKLSNGQTISEEKLDLIREISNRFGNKPEIAEILLDMKIEKDEVDFRYFVSPQGDPLRSDVRLYIGFNENDEWLRFKVKYYDKDWLFVSSYKVSADDYRWQSPKLNFKRDHKYGNVWEWIDISANAKELEVAKALSTANKATIRFQGNKYYSDKTLGADQKRYLQKIIKLFNLMKSA